MRGGLVTVDPLSRYRLHLWSAPHPPGGRLQLRSSYSVLGTAQNVQDTLLYLESASWVQHCNVLDTLLHLATVSLLQNSSCKILVAKF